jgi:hypothetical protein
MGWPRYMDLVDENGKINFPLIGEIQLAGLTRSEATNLIQNKLREFINDAIVTLRIQNFKITKKFFTTAEDMKLRVAVDKDKEYCWLVLGFWNMVIFIR